MSIISSIYKMRVQRALVFSEDADLLYCERCGSPGQKPICKCKGHMVSRENHLENLSWWISVAESEAVKGGLGFEFEETTYPFWPTGVSGRQSGEVELKLYPRLESPIQGILVGASGDVVTIAEKQVIENHTVTEFARANRLAASQVYWGYFLDDEFCLLRVFSGGVWAALARFQNVEALIPNAVGQWAVPAEDCGDEIFQQHTKML